MNEKILTEDSLKEHLRLGQPSTDPEYLAWKKDKIQKALDFARENPDKMIPQRDIWTKFGLEY